MWTARERCFSIGRDQSWLRVRLMRLPTMDEIVAVRKRVSAFARRTPAVPMRDGRRDDVILKLESLQPTGAFKARPAAALMTAMSPAELKRGVNTASSGNFGIAVATIGGALGVPVTIIAPDDAPDAKLSKLFALGTRVRRVSAAAWWRIVLQHSFDGMEGIYLDAVSDPVAMAANGAIALELLEDEPDIDAIAVPFGGGGLLCGVAAAAKALRPSVRIIACECDFAAPLSAARAAGRPVEVIPASAFVSGIGAPSVLPAMWPLLKECVDECVVVSVAETADAVRRLALESRIIAEGAGAVSIAAALSGRISARKTACIVSGGTIGAHTLAEILEGRVPDR